VFKGVSTSNKALFCIEYMHKCQTCIQQKKYSKTNICSCCKNKYKIEYIETLKC